MFLFCFYVLPALLNIRKSCAKILSVGDLECHLMSHSSSPALGNCSALELVGSSGQNVPVSGFLPHLLSRTGHIGCYILALHGSIFLSVGLWVVVDFSLWTQVGLQFSNVPTSSLLSCLWSFSLGRIHSYCAEAFLLSKVFLKEQLSHCH